MLMFGLGMTAMACANAAAGSLPCRYEVAHVIQGPPCPFGLQPPTQGTGISPNGRYVCGFWTQCISGIDESFVFDTQTALFRTIPRPQGISASHATDVCDAGLVVGDMGGTAGSFGYIYNVHTQTYEHMLQGLAPAVGCWINAINASGTVCGTRGFTGAPDSTTTAFIWSVKDGFTDLGLIGQLSTRASDLTDDGQVAVTEGFTAQLWIPPVLSDLGALPGTEYSSGNAISAGGRVVGASYDNKVTVTLPFEYANGKMKQLPTLSSEYSAGVALEVNSNGVIVGACRTMTQPVLWLPCIWRGQTIRGLNSLVPEGSALGIDIAVAVSSESDVLCRGYGSTLQPIAVLLWPLKSIDGDTNCDDEVNVSDLLAIISGWGQVNLAVDLNNDQVVDLHDLLIVLQHWTF